jgi:hypothetical protein
MGQQVAAFACCMCRIRDISRDLRPGLRRRGPELWDSTRRACAKKGAISLKLEKVIPEVSALRRK